MCDKTELQTEVGAMHGLSSAESAVHERLVMLPCPFCARKAYIHVGHRGMNFFLCGALDDGSDGCGAVVSFRPDHRGSSAIQAWNKRTTFITKEPPEETGAEW